MNRGRDRSIFAPALLAAAITCAHGQDIPLPRARPGEVGQGQAAPAHRSSAPVPQGTEDRAVAPPPSACEARLAGEGAVAQILPPLVGAGGCGAPDVVRLDAVVLADAARVAITPAPMLRCTLAEEIVHWVREDVAPAAAALGSALEGIENYDSYDCRGRNRVPGAKLSEHGRANALDVRSLKLANGKVVELTDVNVPREFRDALRTSACERFMTVLGPGSDGYHESHVHVDLAERRNGYRLCEWDVRVPGKPPAGDALAAGRSPPVPKPRPPEADTPAPVSVAPPEPTR